MNLSKLKDHEVLSQIKTLVQSERESLTLILHHLREVEHRKLFSDLKYQSLFDYAVKELKYSEGQAARRIQAMRLLKELPELEEKVQAGDLNLSHLCQARNYFRKANKKSKLKNEPKLSPEEKMDVIEKLENKSAREADQILISLEPELALPTEKSRVLSENHCEIRFVQDEELRQNLEEVRSLLGLKGLGLSFSELAKEMSRLSIQALKEKRFGKKRARAANKFEEAGAESQSSLLM